MWAQGRCWWGWDGGGEEDEENKKKEVVFEDDVNNPLLGQETTHYHISHNVYSRSSLLQYHTTCPQTPELQDCALHQSFSKMHSHKLQANAAFRPKWRKSGANTWLWLLTMVLILALSVTLPVQAQEETTETDPLTTTTVSTIYSEDVMRGSQGCTMVHEWPVLEVRYRSYNVYEYYKNMK